MDKAIEIKRRAQRCILSGDLDGALAEYEKLVALGDPDPYYCVLLADLLYKMGKAQDAQRRYLEAIEGYSRSGLYKNGIAVCKKLSRLSLAPVDVPRWLAKLYASDGLGTEAGLAYQQLADVLIKNDRLDEARDALKQAIDVSPDAARLYERLGEVEVLAGDNFAAGNAWSDAADLFERAGLQVDVRRCRSRIAQLQLAAPVNEPEVEAEDEIVEVEDAPVRSAAREIAFGPKAVAPLSWEAPQPGEIEFTSIAEDAEAAAAGDAALVGDDDVYADDVTDGANGALDGLTSSTYQLDRGSEAGHDAARRDADAAVSPLAPALSPFERMAEEPQSNVQPGISLAGLDPDAYEVATTKEPNGAPVFGSDESVTMERAAAPPEHVTDEVDDVEEAQELEVDEIAVVAAVPTPAPRVVEPVAVAPPAPAPVAAIEPPAPTPAPIEAVAPKPSLGIQRFGDDSSPEAPGLIMPERTEVAASRPDAPADEDPGLAQVSMMLAEAQTCFHSGDRDAATRALIRAAQAYDQMERYDSAVAIYRSLGQSPDVSLQLMMLWLKNCQRRDDRREAARVACDLGDRALNESDTPGARDWFQRARSYDPENEIVARRLAAFEAGHGQSPAASSTSAPVAASPVVPSPAAPAPAVAGATTVDETAGHVHVRTHRDEPVIIDLGVLIAEFQKAIGPELASDPQGHYDLGMSYREMGLTEQAVDSLRIAALVPAFRLRAGELAGRCLLDLGRFDEAADMLRSTLQAPGLPASAAVDLRYQLALALEAAGMGPESLVEFERVYAAQANYPDVAMKIRLLRKSAGAA